jgi:hypothetical protein
MENKISLDLNLFKVILDSEAKKLVGKFCKRFEITDDKETIKKECKELIYESFRDINDLLINGRIIFEFNERSKEK